MELAQKFTRFISGNKTVVKDFAWVTVAQMATMFGGLITIKLLSNLLSISEYGIYSLVFSFASLLVAMLFLPLGQINMRFLVQAQQTASVKSFFSDQKRLFIQVAALSTIVLIPVSFYLTSVTNDFVATFISLTLLTLSMGYQTAQQFLLMAFRLRVSAGIVQLIGAVARPLLTFLAIWIFGYFSVSAVFGLALGFMVLSFAQFIALRAPWDKALNEQIPGEPGQDTERPTNKIYSSYGFFHALIGIVSAVVLLSDRWILSAFGTIEQVAIYAALMQIALAPTAFSFAVLTRLSAPVYFSSTSMIKAEQNRRFLLILTIWLLMCAFILTGTALFHQQIVQLLTHAGFAQYSYLLIWMVLGFLLERTAQVLELRGAMLLKTQIYFLPRLMIIILIPLLEFVLFRILGFDGLVFGLVLAAGFSLLSIVLVNKSRLGKNV